MARRGKGGGKGDGEEMEGEKSNMQGEEKKAPCEGRKREKKAADGVGIKGEREGKKGGVQ